MEVRPFVNSGPEVLPLDTPFSVPEWWRPTGCRWNSSTRRADRDQDGQVRHKHVKKFAMQGEVTSYKFGTVPESFPLYLNSQAGLICSPGACFMVVECDDPETFDTSVLGDAVPTVRSSRGFHYYFAVPPELVPLMPSDGPVPGGDVQTKGFVPAPGTRHPSGVTYELVADRINVADEALLRRLRDAREVRRAELLSVYRDRGGSGTWEGHGGVNGQDDYLSQVVTWSAVAAGKTESEAREAWNREAAALPLADPGDPFTEADFQRHYQGALRKKERGSTWNATVDEMIQAWASGLGGGDGSPPGPLTVNTSDGDEFLPPGYIIPDPFELTTAGVWQAVVKNKQETTEQIAHRPVIMTGVQRNEDGETSYELTWRSHNGADSSVVCPAGDIADRGRLIRVFPEIVVTSKGSSASAEYLAALRTANATWLEERSSRIASFLGWYGREGTEEFVFGNGRPYEVRDVMNLGGWLGAHHERGSMEEWVAAVRSAPWRVQLLIVASLSAPLLRVLGVRGFVLDSSSSTTGGKTKAARAAASAWGDPARLLLSWSDTKVALEKHASAVHGLPVIVDESKLARDPEQISSLVYQVTSGMSAGRAERNGSRLQQRNTIETCLLSNGEQPLLAVTGRRDGGAAARVLSTWGPPFENAAQADALDAVVIRNFGHAGPEFVAALRACDFQDLHHRYQALRESARTLGVTDVARRRGDAAAVLMLAAEIAHDAGLLPRLPELAWVELLAETAGEEGSDDLATTALELVWRQPALNQLAFWEPAPSVGGVPLERRTPPFGGWVGRMNTEENWIAVSPDWLRKLLVSEGFDHEGILRQWSERGWIALDSKGRRQVMVRVAGRPVRCVKILRNPEHSDDIETAASEGRQHG